MPIAHLYADYLASAHLWMVMHSHKCATPTDQAFKHAQKASEVLKSGIMGSQTVGDAENGSRRPASRAVRGAAKPRSTKGTAASKTNVKKVPKTAPVTPTRSGMNALHDRTMPDVLMPTSRFEKRWFGSDEEFSRCPF
jgi:hypothetical protein